VVGLEQFAKRNGDLIVFLRNNAIAIADEIEALRKVAEAAREAVAYSDASSAPEPCGIDACRDALAALDALEGTT
jgi:hypothetical protein